MRKLSTRVLITAIVALAVWFGGQYYCRTALRHRTEIGQMKILTERIKACAPADVKRIMIISNESNMVELDPKHDHQDIVRLMNNLERITVEDRERSVGKVGTLIIELNKPRNEEEIDRDEENNAA